MYIKDIRFTPPEDYDLYKEGMSQSLFMHWELEKWERQRL